MDTKIPASRISDLRSRISLVKLVEQYVNLRPSHDYFIGHCPFHEDVDFSFQVDDHGMFFHCFGCGAQGAHLAFLMRFLSLDFNDAVAEMEKISGASDPRIVSLSEARIKRTGIADAIFTRPGKPAVSFDDIEPFLNKGINRPEDYVLRAILWDWVEYVNAGGITISDCYHPPKP